eukprot:305465-Hanusia_phi.AAC.1
MNEEAGRGGHTVGARRETRSYTTAVEEGEKKRERKRMGEQQQQQQQQQRPYLMFSIPTSSLNSWFLLSLCSSTLLPYLSITSMTMSSANASAAAAATTLASGVSSGET